jgi:ceramide glucosyltransferase
MSLLAAIVLGWFAVSFAYRMLALASVERMCEAPGRTPAAGPVADGVVALRPLRGAGDQLESCLDSLWRAGKSGRMKIVVGVADPSDPALRVVDRVRERWPETPCSVAIGEGPPGLNRKVSNQIHATRGERAEFWLLSDADVRVPDDYSERILAPFADAGVGLATCPYMSVPARSTVSRIDALVTNTHFVANACLAARFEGLHFGLGATIAVRGRVLEQIGGFEALLPVAADDYWLARRVEDAGWRLAWVPMVVEHVLEEEGWRNAMRRHVRWMRVTRASRPVGYLGSFVTHDLPPALAGAMLLAAEGGPAWAPLLGWWTLRTVELWRRRALVRFRARDLWLVPLVDLAALVVWAAGLFGSETPPRGHAG